MPKVVISDAKGVTQSRGAGLHQLSANSKGYVRSVRSASVTLDGGNGVATSTGINIPANAWIEFLSIKLVSVSVDAANADFTAHAIDAIVLGSQGGSGDFDLASSIDVLGGTPGTITSFRLPTTNAAHALAAADELITQTSSVQLSLQEAVTGTEDLGVTDTAAVVEVVVQYCEPQF